MFFILPRQNKYKDIVSVYSSIHFKNLNNKKVKMLTFALKYNFLGQNMLKDKKLYVAEHNYFL